MPAVAPRPVPERAIPAGFAAEALGLGPLGLAERSQCTDKGHTGDQRGSECHDDPLPMSRSHAVELPSRSGSGTHPLGPDRAVHLLRIGYPLGARVGVSGKRRGERSGEGCSSPGTAAPGCLGSGPITVLLLAEDVARSPLGDAGFSLPGERGAAEAPPKRHVGTASSPRFGLPWGATTVSPWLLPG